MQSAAPAGSRLPLCEAFDVALLDLDGVVYLGQDAVPGAVEALHTARDRGMRLAFVTNNAARPPSTVAAHLTALGVPAEPPEVITSAQAAAHYLADRLPVGARVLVLGTVGLVEALAERGLIPVHSAEDNPQAVVQGYSPDLDWRQLAEGAVAIAAGVPWVATNLDPTVPSARGPLPGNGSLVAALRHATGAEPVSTGKPDPRMHRETVERSGAQAPIVVGDRLDTDIEGANAVGCASLLVLTGVTSPVDLIRAKAGQRPRFIGQDLSALVHPHPPVRMHPRAAVCGRWTARRADDGSIVLAGDSGAGEPVDDMDALRAICAQCWRAGRDDHGDGSSAPSYQPGRLPVLRAADPSAEKALRGFGLAATAAE